MVHLLKIEWLKIKNYKAFLFISLFFLIGIFATNYIVYSVFHNIVNKSEAALLLSNFNPYDFEHVWQTVSYASGYLLMLPSLLLIILVTNEYTFKTNRQNIIDGSSREEYANVKMMMALIVAGTSTLFVVLCALVFAYSSGKDFSITGFSHVGYFFLKALSYNIIALFISTLIKRTGFAIGVFFIYMGAENIIAQFLDVLSMKLKSSKNIDFGSLGDYLPMNASDGLLAFPPTPLKSFTTNSLPTEYTWIVLGFAIFYLLLFGWLGRRLIIKKDL
jgi:hypothetical protein